MDAKSSETLKGKNIKPMCCQPLMQIVQRRLEEENLLTFLCALLEGVIDLLEHGLAALLKGWQHDALEGLPVG